MPSPVKAAALELGLPVTDASTTSLDADVPLGVVVAFGRHHQAARPRGGADGEPALLPAAALAGRGAGGAGDPRRRRRTGVDLMAVEEGLDTGGIYRRAEVPIGPDDTLEELRDRLVAEGTRLLVDGAARAGSATPRPQVGEPTYADKLTRRGSAPRLGGPAIDVHRRVRLGGRMDHAPGKRLKVWRTHVPPDGRRPPRCTAGDGAGRARRGAARGQGADGRPRPGRTAPVGDPATGLGT